MEQILIGSLSGFLVSLGQKLIEALTKKDSKQKFVTSIKEMIQLSDDLVENGTVIHDQFFLVDEHNHARRLDQISVIESLKRERIDLVSNLLALLNAMKQVLEVYGLKSGEEKTQVSFQVVSDTLLYNNFGFSGSIVDEQEKIKQHRGKQVEEMKDLKKRTEIYQSFNEGLRQFLREHYDPHELL